jgi:NSS family neurotransmitter:Na+ symporter
MVTGTFVGADPDRIASVFGDMMGSPGTLITFMVVTMAITIVTCSIGLQNGVERITKAMMIALIVIMVVLGLHSLRAWI